MSHFSCLVSEAIDIAIDQILISNLPQDQYEAAIKHSVDELGDKYSHVVDAARALATDAQQIHVKSFRAFRLLQTVALAYGKHKYKLIN